MPPFDVIKVGFAITRTTITKGNMKKDSKKEKVGTLGGP